jgi:hypothetical protein
MFRSLAVVLVTLFVTENFVTASVTAWTDVPVRVYDAVGLDARTRQDALDLARTALSGASVEITWHVCVVATAQSAPCGAGSRRASCPCGSCVRRYSRSRPDR